MNSIPYKLTLVVEKSINMKKILCLVLCLSIIQFSAFAGGDGKKKNKKAPAAATPVKKPTGGVKSIKSVTKKCKTYDGLFTMYQDTTSGKTYLEISEDQIGEEFIYFKHVLDGVLEAGYFKGAYRDNKVFKIEKYFDKIQFVEQNTSYYFDPENAISKASNANINNPVIFSQKIVGMSKGTDEAPAKRYLIDADKIFLSESISQIKPSSRRSAVPTFSLGKLSGSKSKYETIRNYPENSDAVVEYTFDNMYPVVYGSAAVTNPRYVTIKIQHSLVAMPKNDYQPRYEDSRIGYFTSQSTDQTSASATPYRDVIKRWNLKKKNPDQAISEPVEPIVWWMENTTPEEVRPIIKRAALKWNEAFEKAGFKNAVVIKQQPDDAEWDAGDIRYNVLRWTASPMPPFGGYGPCFANPRTGQIIGADIMLEYVAITNRLRFEKYFDLAGMPTMEEMPIGMEADQHFCSAGMHAVHENQFSMFAAEAMDLSDIEKSKMVEESLERIILHELGHTFGLAHNFCASHLYTIDEMNNPEIGGKNGISSSVMDYHATNISLDEEKQGAYAQNKPGLYDKWAIEYGYTEYPNAEAEQKGLEEILSKSTNPQLCFGNDSDDMRSPGRGIDPRMNVSDLSADAIGFSIGRIKLVEQTMPKIKENVLEDGASYQMLRSAYLSMTGNYYGALNVVTRYIGGIYIDRARVGQEVNRKPLTPVPYAEQKRAMNVLSQYAFAPSAFQFDKDLIAYLKMQRRGWNFRGNTEDPKIHSRVLTQQKNLLAHLLHKNTLQRLTDTELYGNKYSTAEMLSDLTAAIIDADLNSAVNTQRQNLQLAYVDGLARVLDDKYKFDYIAKSAALNELNKIKSKMQASSSANESTKAHRKHVIYAVEQILDEE